MADPNGAVVFSDDSDDDAVAIPGRDGVYGRDRSPAPEVPSELDDVLSGIAEDLLALGGAAAAPPDPEVAMYLLARDAVAGVGVRDPDAPAHQRMWNWFFEQVVVLEQRGFQIMFDRFDETLGLLVAHLRELRPRASIANPGYDPKVAYEVITGDLFLDRALELLTGLQPGNVTALVDLSQMVYSFFERYLTTEGIGIELQTLWGEIPPEYESPKRTAGVNYDSPPRYLKRRSRDDEDGGAAGPAPTFPGVAAMFTRR